MSDLFDSLHQSEFQELRDKAVQEMKIESEAKHSAFVSQNFKEPRIKAFTGAYALGGNKTNGVLCLKCVYGPKFYSEHSKECKLAPFRAADNIFK